MKADLIDFSRRRNDVIDRIPARFTLPSESAIQPLGEKTFSLLFGVEICI